MQIKIAMTFDTVSMKIQYPESSPVSQDSSIKCPIKFGQSTAGCLDLTLWRIKLTILIFRLIPYRSKAEARFPHIPPIDDD